MEDDQSRRTVLDTGQAAVCALFGLWLDDEMAMSGMVKARFGRAKGFAWMGWVLGPESVGIPKERSMVHPTIAIWTQTPSSRPWCGGVASAVTGSRRTKPLDRVLKLLQAVPPEQTAPDPTQQPASTPTKAA
jgi:hypothetical protein